VLTARAVSVVHCETNRGEVVEGELSKKSRL